MPHNETRPYTELEAALSLTLDYDGRREVTLRGMAKLWRWSTGKVSRFLARSGVEISNSGVTLMTTPAEQWRDTGETPIFIDSKWLQEESRRKRDTDETLTERKRDVLTNPSIKPKPKVVKGSDFELPEWVDRSIWADFLKTRDKKNVSNEESVLSLIIDELNKLKKNKGLTPNDVLSYSVIGGYPGIYDISERRAKSDRTKRTAPNGNDPTMRGFCGANIG